MSRARMAGGSKAIGTISAKSVHATARNSIVLRPGKDYVPATALEFVPDSAPVGSATGHAFGIATDHLATEQATRQASGEAYGTPHRDDLSWVECVRPVVDAVKHDRHGNIVSVARTLGTATTRQVRLEGLGEETALPARPRLEIMAEQSAQQARGVKPARVARPDKDAEIRAHLAGLGFTGEITPAIRARVLDVFAHRVALAEYAAG